MRRTGLGERGIPWLALAAAIGGWHCSVDDRSPKEQEKEVVASEMPSGGGSDGARFSRVDQTGGAAGATGVAGMGSGGAAGAGMAGGSANGGSAGSNGMTPPGAGGAPSGDLPDDPFGDLGDFGDQGGERNTASDTGNSTGSSNACPGFDACGGALDGTWTYTNVCIDPSENSADLLLGVCPTASVMYERGGASTLTFAGGSVTRTGEPLGDSVITFPAECIEGLGCSFLADALGTDAACTDLAGDCICRTASSVDWSTQSYTTTGGRLALGDGRSFDYCVQGNTLTYRETGDALEAGTHTLTRN